MTINGLWNWKCVIDKKPMNLKLKHLIQKVRFIRFRTFRANRARDLRSRSGLPNTMWRPNSAWTTRMLSINTRICIVTIFITFPFHLQVVEKTGQRLWTSVSLSVYSTAWVCGYYSHCDSYQHPFVGRKKICLEGDGTSYAGSANMTETGHNCKSWIPTKVSSGQGWSVCPLRCVVIHVSHVYSPDNRMSPRVHANWFDATRGLPLCIE